MQITSGVIGTLVSANIHFNIRQARPTWELTFTVTCPSCFCISPRIDDSNEDLPQPTWPTTATRRPGGTEMLTLHTQYETRSYFAQNSTGTRMHERMMPVPCSWHTLVTGMAAAVILYKQPLKMWLFLTLPVLLRHFHMTLVPDLITRHTNLLTSSPGTALSDGVLHINMPSPTVCQQSSAPSYAQAQLNNITVSWSCFWRGQFHALHCLAFSRPRSEAWPYHGQPISIVICCPLLSEAFLFQV